MAHFINFNIKNNILIVHVSNSSGIANTVSYWSEISEYASKKLIIKILVIEDAEVTISDFEAMQIGQLLPKIGFSNKIVAYVNKMMPQHELLHLIKTTALNRGAQGQIFTDEDTAFKWLESV